MPISKGEFLQLGKCLRMEIIVELSNILQLDYEIVERNGDKFTLKLLRTNDKPMPYHPGR